MKHTEPVSDLRGTFHNATYPRGETAAHRFDFIFTKDRQWYYMSSSDDPQKLIDVLAKPVEDRRESWRVVEYTTGEIFRASQPSILGYWINKVIRYRKRGKIYVSKQTAASLPIVRTLDGQPVEFYCKGAGSHGKISCRYLNSKEPVRTADLPMIR